jgi:uncharacterized protein YbaP (TraB family)
MPGSTRYPRSRAWRSTARDGSCPSSATSTRWDLRDALIGVIREDDLRRVRPWYAMSLLTAHVGRFTGTEMDVELARRARAHRIPVEALETWKQQLTALDAVVGIADLEQAIRARTTMRCDLDQLRAAYAAGDRATMHQRLVIPRTAPTLLWARNRSWLPTLERDLADGGGFVAVGLGHLLGESGLPALLVRAGYHVERVARGATVPTGNESGVRSPAR